MCVIGPRRFLLGEILILHMLRKFKEPSGSIKVSGALLALYSHFHEHCLNNPQQGHQFLSSLTMAYTVFTTLYNAPTSTRKPLLIGCQFPIQLAIVISFRIQNQQYFREGPHGDEYGKWGIGQILAMGLSFVNILECIRGYYSECLSHSNRNTESDFIRLLGDEKSRKGC